MARRCVKSLPKGRVRLHGWNVLFGDATDLEVQGNCFDAARMGRQGQRSLRWLTLWLGPALLSQDGAKYWSFEETNLVERKLADDKELRRYTNGARVAGYRLLAFYP